ncbi:MAG: hypothetical protein Q4B23_06495 [Helcococcus sp.]|nr:hypothetical protein [Helcococcus sp.]
MLIVMISCLYYIQSIIEIITYLMINKKIKYVIVYPFVYDGKIRFAPMKLLYKNEIYFNKFAGNLLTYVDNKLKEKTLELIYIEYISKLISSLITVLLLRSMGIFVYKELIVYVIGMNISSIIYEEISYNSLFVTYRNNEIMEKLLTFFYIKENNYFIILNILKNKEINVEYLIDILISLNRNAIVEEVELIDIKYIDNIIEKIRNNENKISLIQDVKIKNIYYLIGFIGKKYNDISYVNYSYDYIQSEINQILKIESDTIVDLKKTKNTLYNFQNFLLCRENIKQVEKYVFYYSYPVFQKECDFNKLLEDIYCEEEIN